MPLKKYLFPFFFFGFWVASCQASEKRAPLPESMEDLPANNNWKKFSPQRSSLSALSLNAYPFSESVSYEKSFDGKGRLKLDIRPPTGTINSSSHAQSGSFAMIYSHINDKKKAPVDQLKPIKTIKIFDAQTFESLQLRQEMNMLMQLSQNELFRKILKNFKQKTDMPNLHGATLSDKGDYLAIGDDKGNLYIITLRTPQPLTFKIDAKTMNLDEKPIYNIAWVGHYITIIQQKTGFFANRQPTLLEVKELELVSQFFQPKEVNEDSIKEFYKTLKTLYDGKKEDVDEKIQQDIANLADLIERRKKGLFYKPLKKKPAIQFRVAKVGRANEVMQKMYSNLRDAPQRADSTTPNAYKIEKRAGGTLITRDQDLETVKERIEEAEEMADTLDAEALLRELNLKAGNSKTIEQWKNYKKKYGKGDKWLWKLICQENKDVQKILDEMVDKDELKALREALDVLFDLPMDIKLLEYRIKDRIDNRYDELKEIPKPDFFEKERVPQKDKNGKVVKDIDDNPIMITQNILNEKRIRVLLTFFNDHIKICQTYIESFSTFLAAQKDIKTKQLAKERLAYRIWAKPKIKKKILNFHQNVQPFHQALIKIVREDLKPKTKNIPAMAEVIVKAHEAPFPGKSNRFVLSSARYIRDSHNASDDDAKRALGKNIRENEDLEAFWEARSKLFLTNKEKNSEDEYRTITAVKFSKVGLQRQKTKRSFFSNQTGLLAYNDILNEWIRDLKKERRHTALTADTYAHCRLAFREDGGVDRLDLEKLTYTSLIDKRPNLAEGENLIQGTYVPGNGGFFQNARGECFLVENFLGARYYKEDPKAYMFRAVPTTYMCPLANGEVLGLQKNGKISIYKVQHDDFVTMTNSRFATSGFNFFGQKEKIVVFLFMVKNRIKQYIPDWMRDLYNMNVDLDKKPDALKGEVEFEYSTFSAPRGRYIHAQNLQGTGKRSEKRLILAQSQFNQLSGLVSREWVLIDPESETTVQLPEDAKAAAVNVQQNILYTSNGKDLKVYAIGHSDYGPNLMLLHENKDLRLQKPITDLYATDTPWYPFKSFSKNLTDQLYVVQAGAQRRKADVSRFTITHSQTKINKETIETEYKDPILGSMTETFPVIRGKVNIEGTTYQVGVEDRYITQQYRRKRENERPTFWKEGYAIFHRDIILDYDPEKSPFFADKLKKSSLKYTTDEMVMHYVDEKADNDLYRDIQEQKRVTKSLTGGADTYTEFKVLDNPTLDEIKFTIEEDDPQFTTDHGKLTFAFYPKKESEKERIQILPSDPATNATKNVGCDVKIIPNRNDPQKQQIHISLNYIASEYDSGDTRIPVHYDNIYYAITKERNIKTGKDFTYYHKRTAFVENPVEKDKRTEIPEKAQYVFQEHEPEPLLKHTLYYKNERGEKVEKPATKVANRLIESNSFFSFLKKKPTGLALRNTTIKQDQFDYTFDKEIQNEEEPFIFSRDQNYLSMRNSGGQFFVVLNPNWMLFKGNIMQALPFPLLFFAFIFTVKILSNLLDDLERKIRKYFKKRALKKKNAQKNQEDQENKKRSSRRKRKKRNTNHGFLS